MCAHTFTSSPHPSPKMGGDSSHTVPSVVKSSEPSLAPPREPSPELDKDVLCPICMQIIKDAFLTSCGHSFCYMCISTHLNNKSDCPCCSHYLTMNHLYPNFLLNKLLMKTSAREVPKNAAPFEQLRHALEQESDASVKDLTNLLSLITDKKNKMEQEEAETNMRILFDFTKCLKKKKIDEMNELEGDLDNIKRDIEAVQSRRLMLSRGKERCSPNQETQVHNPSASAMVRDITAVSHIMTGVSPSAEDSTQAKDPRGAPDPPNATQHGLAVARKSRVHAQFNDLQDYYLRKRREWAAQSGNNDPNTQNREGFSEGLLDFHSVLSTFTRFSRLRVVAEVNQGDLFHSAHIVSSIEFDQDEELFATAGVSRCIRIFEFATAINEPAELLPVAEMSTRSKLSCLSWNKQTKNHLASSDYEGIVTVWDASTRQSVLEYEEHEKRAWSVDFSGVEPSMLVSGSDDCKVKVWCTRQETSVLTIETKANICSVKYNPASSHHIAVGSADHHVLYYDLRKANEPLHTFSAHKKAVSYVRFLSEDKVASASTDSTLRLWDVKENALVRTYQGHKNEKNFVGLTVNGEYLACGSESNDVFVYHKAISKPAVWHKFNLELEEIMGDTSSFFISAVCWKGRSPTMVSANSQGMIKVLVLAP